MKIIKLALISSLALLAANSYAADKEHKEHHGKKHHGKKHHEKTMKVEEKAQDMKKEAK
jgi:hypothetical protein